LEWPQENKPNRCFVWGGVKREDVCHCRLLSASAVEIRREWTIQKKLLEGIKIAKQTGDKRKKEDWGYSGFSGRHFVKRRRSAFWSWGSGGH